MKKLKTNNIRLFVKEQTLSPNLQIDIKSNDFHYLTKVMRAGQGNQIYVFNGFDGEFLAEITQINKKSLTIKLIHQTSPQQDARNITLAFALIKNIKIDTIATKATEMGAKNFQPLLTQHTIPTKLNEERFQANIKEACEQCQRTDIASLSPTKTLDKFLKEEDSNKIYILCDETLFDKEDGRALSVLSKLNVNNKEIIILIGPEG
ncbi:MAG: 16S rRNA (uracil(1498)-N(3))-methyltransferase, partial [Rickettsiales bacterium]|nr:16S rRNA (uracil(1498)-N(3))-methyltransferase [Rickettsiales bacterium]